MRLIDVDEVIETYGGLKTRSMLIGTKEECKAFNDGVQYMVNAMRNAPTVDPVVHAHWEYITCGNARFQCSHCHRLMTPMYDMNFCMRCGAKMD